MTASVCWCRICWRMWKVRRFTDTTVLFLGPLAITWARR